MKKPVSVETIIKLIELIDEVGSREKASKEFRERLKTLQNELMRAYEYQVDGSTVQLYYSDAKVEVVSAMVDTLCNTFTHMSRDQAWSIALRAAMFDSYVLGQQHLIGCLDLDIKAKG